MTDNGETTDHDRPLVSVIIPAYNAQRYIGEAIESVLNQSWRDLECWVIDDGSIDETAGVVAKISDPRLRYQFKGNEGTVSSARNLGIELSKGKYVAFLDADDVWLPDKLFKQMDLIGRRPDLGFVYCGYAITDRELNPLTYIVPRPAPDMFLRTILLEANGIGAGFTMVVRRDALDSFGGFRTELSMAADAELAERLASNVETDCVPECLVLYRSHPGQGHRDLKKFEHENIWVLEHRLNQGLLSSDLYRRGLGNLNTRMFFYELKLRHPLRSVQYLRAALSLAPDRLVGLPAEAIFRRSWRRIHIARMRRSRPSTPQNGV